MTAHGKKQPMHMRKAIAGIFLLFILILFSTSGFSQNISISLSRVSLEKAFREIEKKTDYRFVYTKEMAAQGNLVTMNVKNGSLKSVLDLIFENQPLEFSLDDRFITVRFKSNQPVIPIRSEIDIRGRILSENGEAIAGASVQIKGSAIATATDESGRFKLQGVNENAILLISSIGYLKKEIALNGRSNIEVKLPILVSSLDETIVIAYGTTTNRLNTGNISKVNAEEISKQPVSNSLAALQGRVPGLLITQSSGLNGSGFSVQIRGQNSIVQGSEPLFIIDGVPYAPGNRPINLLSTNATRDAGLSPLNLINPSDIESIEVLKDADATAIYGSRGANGIILITTKKGKAGATKINANFYTGRSKVTRTMNMLNTRQYIEMRREGFQNDGVIPNVNNAPDISLWDTTRYTDLKKLLIGGSAHTTDAQISFSGGNSATQFFAGVGFHRETSVFPTDLGDQKASAHFNLTHSSTDKKFSINLTGNYVTEKNELHLIDPTGFIALPPNVQLYDSIGKINWQESGVPFYTVLGGENPLANLKTEYVGNFSNLISNLQLGYRLLKNLNLKLNLGYNTVSSDEKEINPSTSLDPNLGQLPFSYFGIGNTKSWIIEPQAEYNRKYGKGRFNVLFGATAQENVSSGINVSASNYSSDIFLNSISGAANVLTSNSNSKYRYNAFFGRISYNLNDHYLLNISGRRDGSTRFGPNRRFSNFGAASGAWIFSAGKEFKKQFRFISFGKLRGSYGITGNDQIGDYRFIDTWTASPVTYQGVSTLNPTSLYNPDYEWEANKKFETALELGFFKDRLLISSVYFRNRSSNQIVQYSLPTQTGFTFIGKNLKASIQNAGLEFQITSKNYVGSSFNWTTNFNSAFTRNKLLSFPGLATSSYATRYVIGEPLSIKKAFQYLGIDSSGIYQFTDDNNDGKYNTSDRIILVNTDPDFYGGLQNTFTYKGLQLSLLFEFKKQIGLNYNSTITASPPGALRNQPIIVFNRWRMPGDKADVQKFTATFGTPAYRAGGSYLGISEAAFSDASFVRLKNLALSYSLPAAWLKSIQLETGRIYLQAQNLLTITNYEGADPENQNMFILPPLRTITAGIQFNF